MKNHKINLKKKKTRNLIKKYNCALIIKVLTNKNLLQNIVNQSMIKFLLKKDSK